MKKMAFVLFILVASFAHTIELWNGFTTDMTLEQFLDRAHTMLSPRNLYQGEGYGIPSSTRPAHDGYGYPRNLIRVRFDADIQVYGNVFTYASVTAYFFNGKLFFLTLMSNALSERDALLRIARERHGTPQRTLPIMQGNAYYWRLPGIDLYSDSVSLVFVDRTAREQWLLTADD